MWVNTIVRIRPMRPAMRGANRAELAVSRPLQKNTAPDCAVESPNRSESQSTRIDCTAKPPPKASRLNRAERRITMARDRPRPLRPSPGTTTGGRGASRR